MYWQHFRNNISSFFFQIEVHEELADADKISANGSVPTSNSDQDAEDVALDAEDVALNGNGNGYQNGNCQEIRRSTIMFVIKSNQDLTKTASQQNGSKPSPIRGLISGNGKNNHVSTPELRDSNTSLHHAQRQHSHMTSDVFEVFLTYLPTLIRYFTT